MVQGTETSSCPNPAFPPSRIADLLGSHPELPPDHPALLDVSGVWTYAELEQAVRQTRTWLAANGVRAGDRVMIVSENCRAFAALAFAISSLDAWPVPVNARMSAREIDEIRDHCDPRRIVYLRALSQRAKQHVERRGAQIVDIPPLGSLGISPLNEQAIPEKTEAAGADQVALLLYTSGTTGRPKGVMLTHANVLFIAAAASQIRSLTPKDRIYGVLPMPHVVGFSVNLLSTILSGATLFISPRFDPVAVQRDIEEHKLTVMLGVPSMYALLAEYARLKGITSFNFPSLRIISSSGAPLSRSLKEEVEGLFGMTLCHSYGITECSPTIAQVRLDAPRRDTSVGPPLPGVEVKLVDPSGQCVPDGEIGELWVRGPNLMKGYYRAPEETTAAVNADGWFNTRDLARLQGGNLFIVGRTKEMIVRFGFNVYPAEVENVLNAHPAVARSAVVGRAEEGTRGGEEVIAFVQLKDNEQATAAELSAHATRHLAPYKIPSQFILIPEMPLTSTGKIRKDQLARLAAKPPS
jgi:long-chain acyl-CoA synthetase